MLGNFWYKKEKPLLTIIGMGGGATSLPNSGAAANGMDASGGVVNDYEDANSPGTYWRSHMFQLSGAFVVNELSTSADCPNDIDILLVGGGGGGSGDNGGGGGAGGVLCYSSTPEPEIQSGRVTPAYTVTAQSYPITIGSGGAGRMGEPPAPNAQPGDPGANTTFSTPTAVVYTAGYGGGGRGRSSSSTVKPGGPAGGSGGGGGLDGPISSYGLATPTNPNASSPPLAYGRSGGGGGPGPKGAGAGGGGGGAGGYGGSGGSSNPGDGWNAGSGGAGMQNLILGPMLPSPKAYWGGGGSSGFGPPAAQYMPDGSTQKQGGDGGVGGGGAGNGTNTWKIFTASLGFNNGGAGWAYNGNGTNPDWDKGNKQQSNGGGRWTGGGGGATGGGRGGEKGNLGGNGGEGTCIIRYKITESQAVIASAKATGGYTSQYGGKTIHVFNESGTFTNTSGAPLDCEVVAIAGGGGGGFEMGGGGGAGGFLVTPSIVVSPGAPTAITVTVGAGGYGQTYGPGNSLGPTLLPARNGGNSTFGPTITAIGGGYGGNGQDGPGGAPTSSGGGGGSGGGSGEASPGSGAGPTSPTQGYSGGDGSNPNNGGGGGGGAGGAGNDSPGPNLGGPGGIGKQLPTTFQDPQLGWGAPGPSPGRWFCGGGGGGQYGTSGAYYSGGGGGPVGPTGATPWAGGGNGGSYNNDLPISGGEGWINTGGGGGGGGTSPTNGSGGGGGPGIVFVAYTT